MNDWESSKTLASNITADYFKLRELRDAIADVAGMTRVLVRSDVSVDHFQVLIHAMTLQQTVIAARLRLALETYETLTNIERKGDG